MQPDLATPATSGLKRALIGLSAVVESFSFYILTLTRFEGQGLTAQFFRFSTKSDTISNLLYLFTLAMLFRAFRKPEIISMRRTITLTILATIIMVVTLEARNFEAGEFPRIASILYLTCRALFLALLVPRREYDLTHLAGIAQVIRNAVLVLLGSIVVAFVFSFTYTVTSDYNELKIFDADAGVVLGAAVWHGGGEHPSPTLKERINVAEDLIKRGIVPKLVVTGSNATGEKPEAEIAKAQLLASGIEENRIVAETSSHSTLEQILYLRNELVTKQGWRRFVIISDQYHLARVIEMCKFNGIDAIGTPSNIRQTVFDLAYYRLRESVALLAYWILGK
ncbi:MAG TPA: YdcF family protein [Candidatus Kapabacteria bacterium]|nr:YdcF family protein [Candidatus Kapabacteria bacterium]